MTDPEVEHAALVAQIDALRAADPRTPTAIRLGASQREAIEAYVRQVSGQADVGPVLSFAGLDVRASKRADHVALLWADGDDPEPAEDAPAEVLSA